MKALVKAHAEPGLWMQEQPEPSYAENEILIKIKKTAICGTDLHIYQWDEWASATVKVPTIIGHEFSGEVVAVGSAVKNFQPGDRVSGEGHITCGICRNCRAGRRHYCRKTRGIGVQCNGCFAEYLALPEEFGFHLPEHISDDVGAILDPLGNACHTALAFDVCGEDVLITGAGPVGLMAAAICRQAGARHIVITDVNPKRLAIAKQMGVTLAVNPQQQSLADAMRQLKMDEGFDVGLEMSGVPSAFNQMIELVNHGGHIALLGIVPKGAGIDWPAIIFKSITLRGIYGREMFDTWYKMSSLLQSGLNVQPVITQQLDASDFAAGFQALSQGEAAKVILNWS